MDLKTLLEKNKAINIVMAAEDFLSIAQDIASMTAKEVLLNHQEKVFTRQDVCTNFNISYATLNRWEKNELIKGVKIGRRKYYTEKEINKLLSSSD